MENLFFFDSHGALWCTCSPEDDGAEAFGPRGASRQADPAGVGLDLQPEESAWGAAARTGRVIVEDTWPPGLLAVAGPGTCATCCYGPEDGQECMKPEDQGPVVDACMSWARELQRPKTYTWSGTFVVPANAPQWVHDCAARGDLETGREGGIPWSTAVAARGM